MTYFTGSTANTANCAKDFMEVTLHPNLLTAGFTYVEEVVGPSTNVNRIYKSASASNGVGDWYLIVNRNTDAGTILYFGVCEDYDSVGHLAKRWAPTSGVSAGLTFPADRSHPTTAGIAPTSAGQTQVQVTTSPAAHAYILSLHPKRVVISTKVGASNWAIYAGLYEPMLPGVANHFPLIVSGVQASNNSQVTAYTREMGTGTSVAVSGGYGSFVTSIGFTGTTTGYGWPEVLTSRQMDGYLLKPTVTRLYLPPSQSKIPGYRGIGIGVYGADRVFAWGDIANIDWAGTPITATCVFVPVSGSNNDRLVDQAF